METGTFNVKEFASIYTMIDENSAKMQTKANQVMSLCEQLAQIVKSADSGLSTAYMKIAEAVGNAKSKAAHLLDQLKSEMQAYELKTIGNEEETSEELKAINDSIERIAAVFNDIAKRNG